MKAVKEGFGEVEIVKLSSRPLVGGNNPIAILRHEIGHGVSEEAKRRNKENPEIGRQQGETLRRRYEEDPELRSRMSELNKQKYIDRPELKDQISENMKEYWRNYPGGWQGFLSKFSPEKQKEIERARSINSKER